MPYLHYQIKHFKKLRTSKINQSLYNISFVAKSRIVLLRKQTDQNIGQITKWNNIVYFSLIIDIRLNSWLFTFTSQFRSPSKENRTFFMNNKLKTSCFKNSWFFVLNIRLTMFVIMNIFHFVLLTCFFSQFLFIICLCSKYQTKQWVFFCCWQEEKGQINEKTVDFLS